MEKFEQHFTIETIEWNDEEKKQESADECGSKWEFIHLLGCTVIEISINLETTIDLVTTKMFKKRSFPSVTSKLASSSYLMISYKI